MMFYYAVCEACGKKTLSPKSSLDGKRTLCPECAKAEEDYWKKHYADQQALTELYRKAESEE